MAKATTADRATTTGTTGKRRGPVPGSEAAKRGGQAVHERYGREFYSRIGKKGGETVKATRGSDFYAEIGERGGQATKQLYGFEHFSAAGRKGGLASRGRRWGKRSETTQATR